MVLGAGASMQYQFPSGSALKARVVHFLDQPQSLESQILVALEHSPEDIAKFHSALFYSGKPSVDAFLEHRTEFTAIGKAAMACALLPQENRHSLFAVANSWYEYLHGRMNCPLEEFGGNAIAFITFNYDRSLECYLHTCLVNTYGLSDDQAALALSEIPIIHVHGQLGRLPWQVGPDDARAYNQEMTPESVAIASKSIRVIHEDAEGDPILEEATKVINSAERLVFLGFGYLEQNITRLRLDLDRRLSFLGGTAVGLKAQEQARVRRGFRDRIVLGHEYLEVLDYLREKVSLE